MDEFSIVKESISKELLSKGYCSSLEESYCIAEEVCLENNLEQIIILMKNKNNNSVPQKDVIVNGCVETLLDYVSHMTEKQANILISNAMDTIWNHNNDDNDDDDSQSDDISWNDDHPLDTPNDSICNNEEEEYIGEGECEICERTIQLTKHHLIPKATWPKMKKRMIQASTAISNKDYVQATKILGMDVSNGLDMSLPNFPQKISSSSLTIYLGHNVCNLCSPCHKTVHRLHTEMELAQHYNTVEKLLSDERMMKFAKWANKQKPGKQVRRK